MIFTIQNLGFAIGGFLLEGWLAFAAPVSYTHLTLPTTPYV